MSSLDKTMYFNFEDNNQKDVRETLETVYQIVGYLLSGDPAYIPRLNDARNLIRRHERDEIIEELVRSYLDKEDK